MLFCNKVQKLRLSKRSGSRSGVIGSPLPPRRLHDREVFRRSGRPIGPKTDRLLPQASPPPQGMGAGAVSDRARSDRPSWGFTPLWRHQPKRSGSPGFASPGTVRPRGFSPPRRVALSRASRTRWVRCRLWGSHSRSPFGRGGRDASPRSLRSFAHGAFQPRTLRNTRSQAPQARKHLSPPALVPWPWSQDSREPLRSTSFPNRRRGFRPGSSPRTLRPSAAG
jgi:hypothetical protein